MAVKIVTAAIVFIVSVALGAAVLFFLLLAFNGFNSRTAEYALLGFVLVALLVSALAAAGGFFFSGSLAQREWNPILNVALSVTAMVVVAFVVKVILSFVAVLIANAAQ
jgi:ABC-type enterobactin transport system permease subunit